VRLAVVVEGAAGDGGAGLGSTVCVVDAGGRTADYRLIGRRGPGSTRNEVTMASPVGQALWGVRPGDVARVALPDGRARELRVLDVLYEALPAGATSSDDVARAA
jgi:transcription elongation GreA/GreB family factor